MKKKLSETTTLILKGRQFKVDKQKLIYKSQYFAALLSKNYIDYHKRKHIILYDIPITLMEMFLDWIHHDYLPSRRAREIRITSNPEEFNNLFDLLEISVLFAADKLIEDITDIFEQRYMKPEYLLDIWLYANELGIKILQDLSFSVSLDRFMELPRESLCKLQKKDFLKFICNINLRCSDQYLSEIINHWVQINLDDTIYNEWKLIDEEFLENSKKSILQAIIMFDHADVNSDFFIYCWDGKEFFKFTSFKYPKDINKHCNCSHSALQGEIVVARGYNLYLLGGQHTCNQNYNKKVWRYSLISKKWYFQTVMPIARRDMIAAFIKNKLIILAGIGQHGRKVNRIDIYDVHADTWIVDEFSRIWETNTKHFVINRNLYLLEKNNIGSYICIYSSVPSNWQFLNFPRICSSSRFIYEFQIPKKPPILTFDNGWCHLNTKEKVLNVACNMQDCSHVGFKYRSMCDLDYYKRSRTHEFIKNMYLLNICFDIKLFKVSSNNEDEEEIHKLPIIACCNRKVDSESCYSIDYSNLHLHRIPLLNLPSLCRRSEFFNLMDPNHLHTSLLRNTK